jgi:glyoxylase-like metal-dependent hydrolase (beta-lactamase superfamily II)
MTKKIAPNVYRLTVGGGGAFLLDDDGEVTLIDTGVAGNAEEIWGGLKTIRRSEANLKHVLITHYHQDHIGCLPEIKERCRVDVYAPTGDAELIRTGGRAPKMETRGVLGALLSQVIKMADMPPCEVDREVAGGDELAIAGGISVIAAPGHTRGQVAYLWRRGSVLFAGDAAMNFLGKVRPMPVAEDFALADASLARLAQEDFAVAGFGHGAPIRSRASKRFRRSARRLR